MRPIIRIISAGNLLEMLIAVFMIGCGVLLVVVNTVTFIRIVLTAGQVFEERGEDTA